MEHKRLREGNELLWITLLGFALLLNALENPFLLDDLSKIVQNPDLRSFTDLPTKLFRPYIDGIQHLERNDPSRPLVFLVYTVLYGIGGGAVPVLFHLFSALVHVGTAILAWLLARRILPRSTDSRSPALFTALFLVALPIQIGVATYAYGLSDLLAAFFLLASILFLSTKRQLPSILCFAAALASKQSAIVMPALGGLWLFSTGESKLREWKRLVPHVALAVLYLTFRFLRFGGIGDLEGAGNTFPVLEYLSLQPYILWRYVQLTLWPQGLAVDHFVAPSDVPASLRLLSIAAWLAVIAGILLLLRRHRAGGRLLAIGLAWWFICLAPTSSFVPTVDLLVERRVYLANFGLLLGVFGSTAELIASERIRRTAAFGAFFLLLLASGISIRRNHLYGSAESAWKDVLSVYPRSPRAMNNLAAWLIERKRFAEAKELLEQALSQRPDDAFLWSNLGSLLQESQNSPGDFERAIECFRRAIALRPQLADAQYNLGRMLQIKGEAAEAERHYRIALDLRPSHAPTLNNLGLLILHRGQKEDAIAYFERSLLADPAYEKARENLALARGNKSPPEERQAIPLDQVPAELIIRTYESHLKNHPNDETARRKFREFCKSRNLSCESAP